MKRKFISSDRERAAYISIILNAYGFSWKRASRHLDIPNETLFNWRKKFFGPGFNNTSKSLELGRQLRAEIKLSLGKKAPPYP